MLKQNSNNRTNGGGGGGGSSFQSSIIASKLLVTSIFLASRSTQEGTYPPPTPSLRCGHVIRELPPKMKFLDETLAFNPGNKVQVYIATVHTKIFCPTKKTLQFIRTTNPLNWCNSECTPTLICTVPFLLYSLDQRPLSFSRCFLRFHCQMVTALNSIQHCRRWRRSLFRAVATLER